MLLQARVRIWGRPQGREAIAGLERFLACSHACAAARVGAGSYQKWHNTLFDKSKARNWELLDEDGKLGDQTRAQLIGDYMNMDGTTLPSTMRVMCHGCGEAFPLPEPTPECAWERFSSMRNRRVEFFFFDQAVGVTPMPASPTSAPGSLDYPAWLAKAEIEDLTTEAGLKEVTFVEMHDALFRTNSAVVLPEGEDPTSKQGGSRALTSVGLFATVLRYNDLCRGKKLFIAGHTDTKGSDQFNQPLSEERAKVVLALLTGKRDDFVSLCDKRHDEIDVTQIFDWTARAYGFTCKPTTLTAIPNDERYQQFRTSFNAWVAARDPAQEPDSRSDASPLAERGRLDRTIWRAIFDLYEYDLRQELEETRAGVEALRSKLVWVDDSRRTMGFGERFPVDNLARNDFRSQSNRRVEVLMFDPGEAPDLAAVEATPESADLYLPGIYGKLPVAMSSAGPAYAWVESESLIDIPRATGSSVPISPIEETENEGFYVVCPSVDAGGFLAPRHALAAGNISPSLYWSGHDSSVTEFVLVLYDCDAQDLLHWLVRDIGPAETGLPEDAALPAPTSAAGPSAAVPYRGPEPPPNETHRYIFRLYALPNPVRGITLPSTLSQLDQLLIGRGGIVAETSAFFCG